MTLKYKYFNKADLDVDCHNNPILICLIIKQRKTDPFHQGVKNFLGANSKLPRVRPSTPRALFMFSLGPLLTCSPLVSNLHSALHQADFNHKEDNGHSFRNGVATTAAQRGLEDSLIQTLGHWKSDAYIQCLYKTSPTPASNYFSDFSSLLASFNVLRLFPNWWLGCVSSFMEERHLSGSMSMIVGALIT